MLMNSRGGPPHLERGSASRDNFYGSSGMYLENCVTKGLLTNYVDQKRWVGKNVNFLLTFIK